MFVLSDDLSETSYIVICSGSWYYLLEDNDKNIITSKVFHCVLKSGNIFTKHEIDVVLACDKINKIAWNIAVNDKVKIEIIGSIPFPCDGDALIDFIKSK